MRKTRVVFVGVFMLMSLSLTCHLLGSDRAEKVKSSAYPGHGHDNDQDVWNLLAVFPASTNTTMDDCRVCHPGGIVKKRKMNSCDYCHATINSPEPWTPLNVFGFAYLHAGRSVDAVKSILAFDSDGDGWSNGDEIRMRSYPGEADSVPNQQVMSNRILSSEDLSQIPRYSQFLLVNTTRHEDCFVEYSGWKLTDILQSVGSNLDSVTHVTAISWDGFRRDYSREEIFNDFPKGLYYEGMNRPEYLKGCPAWVEYPAKDPERVKSGKVIPDVLRLILADERWGIKLDPLSRNEKGKLKGEGPFRMIMPQKKPDRPDQPLSSTNPDCPDPYNPKTHHNGGDCARGVIALLVHPATEGSQEPDWRSKADELIRNRQLMVFGNIQQK